MESKQQEGGGRINQTSYVVIEENFINIESAEA